MAYDGSIITEKLVQALLALPGAIKNLKDLFQGSKDIDKKAVKQLEEIRNYLISFEEVNDWLLEAKNHHDAFQSLDTALEPIRAVHQTATSHGPLNIQEFKIAEVRMYWKAAQNHSLIKILTLAKTIKRIEKEPLRLDKDGKFLSGPDWAISLSTLSSNVDKCFDRFDSGEQNIVSEVVTLFGTINRLVKENMHLLNERIKNEAVELSTNLAKLAGGLKNV